MSFPDLNPLPDDRNNDKPSTIWAQATGAPVNGSNVVGLPFVDQGIPPYQITEDWLRFRVDQLTGPSITGASVVNGSLAPDKRSITLNFAQGGADECTVTCQLVHTEIS